MNTSRIARTAARRAVVAKPRASCHARTVSTNPPPPPIGPEPIDKKGTAAPFMVGALVAAGGVGYYYYTTQSRQEELPEVGQKARELENAARVQTQKKIDDGRLKENGKAKVDSAQGAVQDGYNSATAKANAAATDAQARLASYKDAASNSLQQARESTEKGAHDAKAYVDQKGQNAKSTWWSWLGWGSSKSEEAKEAAAQKAAQSAAGTKQAAADVEKAASKRA
ncbi:hypothetical protein M0805_005795 [Coniferiporia weirii]|nr:hypothetical protein M0805_005795 [Coniferiporia weirii]